MGKQAGWGRMQGREGGRDEKGGKETKEAGWEGGRVGRRQGREGGRDGKGGKERKEAGRDRSIS